jgi:hypothetical protein
MVIGGGFFVSFGIQHFAKQQEFNSERTKKPLIKYTHYVIGVCSFLMFLWNIDPNSYYGMYPPAIAYILKDAIAIILASDIVFYAQTMFIVYLNSKDIRLPTLLTKKWIIPVSFTNILIIADIISISLTLHYNQEIYRAIIALALLFIILTGTISAIVVLVLVVKSERALSKPVRTGTNNRRDRFCVKWGLFQSFVLFIAAIILTVLVLIQIFQTGNSAPVSPPQSGVPLYSLNKIALAFTLALLFWSFIAWVPIRKPQRDDALLGPRAPTGLKSAGEGEGSV